MRKLGGNFGRDEEARTANIGLAIWRLKYFYETFMQGSTAVILLNFSAENSPHRQALYVSGHAITTVQTLTDLHEVTLNYK